MRAQRGNYLETQIKKILAHLNNTGAHGHKNHAERTKDGTYICGEPFDFEVISNGRIFTFDAKECHADAWSLQNAKLNQVKALYDAAQNGAEAFFLVWFATRNKIVRFDIYRVKEALEKGVSSLRPEDGSVFDWRIFLS